MKRLRLYGLLAAGMVLATCPATLLSARPAQKAASPAKAEPARKPRNVVFILLDDLRYDGMGFLQPELRTPNIDRLARGGTYFPNTVVTSSLCSPSRATILTGETARNHGIVDNANSSEAGLTFFPSYLQKAGYQTAFIGKWHMGNDVDTPRPGFNKWVSFRGQGSYYPASGDPDAAVQGGETTMWNVDGKKVAQQGYITDELTDYAMNWLEKERDKSKPFFLYLSHKAVHSDPLPPPRYRHLYDRTDFKIPASAANTPENYKGKPMWVYNQRNTWHGIDFFFNTDMKMTEYLRYYYGALAAVDDSVGRIADYLKANGLEKDTLVVFTADNGFQIGDHGLIDKRTAYQASVRVPMVMYEPGTVPAGVVNTGRIRNLDYAPTFLDLAGVEKPAQFEGVSAWPLITGKVADKDWKAPDFTYEYYWEWAYPMTPGTFAIQRDNLKYIQYYGVYDTDELYDLARDPDEMHNLIDDPAYLQAKVDLRKALYQQLANRDGRHAIPYGERNAIGSVRRNRAGTGAAPFPDSWLVEPNRVDRKDNVLPDSVAKQRANDEGKAFVRFPVLGSPEANANAGIKD
ncbi:MAG: sulfatase [Pseudomonadota bacterium]|uniref:Acetylglucosamine-6-sulfatase n=1 Tax=Sphingobium xenophagum TaxID=121428 RepID=A0A249MSQ3_SPHXE|nr:MULTISPECIES: sulfatase [Sphingobium]ASY44391.1 acetylglucosamine-6-sulfatase [Sphingobium xenophagum]OUC56476.1 acetylglucosamine-6-sulfatase [Sphingobium sp. GW456-12-10-14-TSB1]QWT15263.1 sulfatase [Sphingobium xenophagum]